jgi:hypothetical protein
MSGRRCGGSERALQRSQRLQLDLACGPCCICCKHAGRPRDPDPYMPKAPVSRHRKERTRAMAPHLQGPFFCRSRSAASFEGLTCQDSPVTRAKYGREVIERSAPAQVSRTHQERTRGLAGRGGHRGARVFARKREVTACGHRVRSCLCASCTDEVH